MNLAFQVLRSKPNENLSRVTRIYKVPRIILSDRCNRKPTCNTTIVQSRKLIILEEEVIIRYILDLDSRAFPPRRSTVDNIANQLFSIRDSRRVGKN
jgi:hypothetical protein